jgi:3-hydroxyacyl-CoA dehydrogenase
MQADEITHVGIAGGGLIGMSWAALYLAHGLRVSVYDPAPETADALPAFVMEAWPHLRALGLTLSASPPEASVSTSPECLADVDFLQENGPDRLGVKQALVATLEDVIAPEIVIASSTSSVRASDIQAQARHPHRILVAHPMNPPHLVPMVELVAGDATDPATVDLADAFYRRMNRVPVRVKKEVQGHLANRLTSALYREAVHLVAEGIADVADIDTAIAYGPGMRWALMGPHLIYHLGGGAGGYRGYLDHLGPTQAARWAELGTPELTDDVKAALVDGLEQELEGQDTATLRARRDSALVELVDLKKRHGF